MGTWKLVFGTGLGEISGLDDGLTASFPPGHLVTMPAQSRLRPGKQNSAVLFTSGLAVRAWGKAISAHGHQVT